MSNPHIVKAFDQELRALTRSVGAMGEFAGAQFAHAMQALLTHDIALAQRVIDQDLQLDALRRDLSTAAAAVIARRQPMAVDLDEVLADFRIADDLERIGDLAKNIARRATAVAAERFPEDVVDSLKRLSALASVQLGRALEIYRARDAEQALAVRDEDDQIDELHAEIFRDIVARMSADNSHVAGLVHLLFCAKNIERIGDHATQIAEAACVAASDRRPTPPGPESGGTPEADRSAGRA